MRVAAVYIYNYERLRSFTYNFGGCVYYKTQFQNDICLNTLNELQMSSSILAIRDSDVYVQKTKNPSSQEEKIQLVNEIDSRVGVADKIEKAYKKVIKSKSFESN